MLHKIKYIILNILLALFLINCGGDSSSGIQGFTEDLSIESQNSSGQTPSYIFDENEKSYLYNLFLTEYFWNDQVPSSFDYSAYAEPQPMIDDLKYSAIDHWSFSLSREQYDNFTAQQTLGFGFGYTADLTVYLTRIGSPAESAGLLRGDRIVSINGQPASSTLIAQVSQNTNQSTQFTVERLGSSLSITITSQYYSYRVTAYSVVQSPTGNQVGYLRFDEFTSAATEELENAFNYFHGKNIDKLVIDLRYNGGGSVNTASVLLDKIGKNFNGQLQFTLAWNEQNNEQNEALNFDSLDPNSLALSKLVFLTTGGSASASEAVINAIKPYMLSNTAIVGENTYGKPVGMSGRTNGSYIYFLINFVIMNSVGFYEYFDGLPVDCYVQDNDFSHQLGDPNEALLNEALYYIDNNHC